MVLPPSTPENMEMKELEAMRATSRLPVISKEAGPSCLLSPVHLRRASLPAVDNEGDMAMAPLVVEESREEAGSTLTAMVGEGERNTGKAAAAANNEDTVGEEDLGAGEAVAEPPVAEGEGEEPLREEPNWQWLLPYGPTSPWMREVLDEPSNKSRQGSTPCGPTYFIHSLHLIRKSLPTHPHLHRNITPYSL